MTDATPIPDATTPETIAPETLALRRAEGTAFALSVFPSVDATAPAILVEPAMGVPAGYSQKLAAALCSAASHPIIPKFTATEQAQLAMYGTGVSAALELSVNLILQ